MLGHSWQSIRWLIIAPAPKRSQRFRAVSFELVGHNMQCKRQVPALSDPPKTTVASCASPRREVRTEEAQE